MALRGIAAALTYVFQDWNVNTRNVKFQLVLAFFRAAQLSRAYAKSCPLLYLILVAYRVIVEWILGIELPWNTKVGRELRIFHGHGLVVNDHSVIGERVILRNGVTIGHLTAEGQCPVIGDGVEIGAGAILLGEIEIGAGARIGAGAVVRTNVPAFATAIGNPATVRSSQQVEDDLPSSPA